jgi:hypothetical protein
MRVGLRYRALATEIDGGLLWFWIGSHTDYDALVGYAMNAMCSLTNTLTFTEEAKISDVLLMWLAF